jgi:uncharacterized protein (TIGR02996 family)
MTQGEGIFPCVLDNPEDNTSRVVYADWLEEHSDPDRAEPIRVEMELPRLAPWSGCRKQAGLCRARHESGR